MGINMKKGIMILTLLILAMFCVSCAFASDVNETLEVSQGLDNDLSNLEDGEFNQIAVGNDEQTNGSSSLGESNSENMVSNYEDTSVDAKDSDNNIIKASDEGNDVLADNPIFTVTNTALNPYAKVGDEVGFEIYVENNGGTYDGMYDQENNVHFVGLDFIYDSSNLEYCNYAPTAYSGNYSEPVINPNQNLAQFAYRIGDEGFKNGDNFNFTVTFKVKNPGTLNTTASVRGFDFATSTNQTDVADFIMTVTPSDTTVILNKGDEINFNIFVINRGGTFYPDPSEGNRFVGIDFRYNSNVLNYTGYTPCRTTDGNNYEEKYIAPKISPSENLAQFAFNVSDEGFRYGYNFNFTVTFKVIEYGTSTNNISVTQYPNISRGVMVISRGVDLTITSVPIPETLKLGGDVRFHYMVKNKGAKYGGDTLIFDIYFDADMMKYDRFTEITNLNFISLENISAQNSTNPVLERFNSTVGHLKLDYMSVGGFDAGSSFDFDVVFETLIGGKLETYAVLTSVDSECLANVSAYAFAEGSRFKLTLTAENYIVNEGGDVSFEVLLKNIGTTTYTDNQMVIYVYGYYDPEELEYAGYTINPGKDGAKPVLDIGKIGDGNVTVKFDLIQNGLTEGWAPGSTLNVTLRFKVKSEGIISNMVSSVWHANDVCSVVSGNLDGNLTKKCLNSTADAGDLIYYEIYLENTGNFKYSNLFNESDDDYLIIEDLYPSGLEYVNYTLNQVKKDNYSYVGPDGDGRVIIKYKIGTQGWAPGESLNVTLIFRATDFGIFTNTVKFNYILDDSGEIAVNLSNQAKIIVGLPAFAIEMNSSREADVGDIASFSIVYSNTGNRTITGAYIKDSFYSKGLEYYDCSDNALWEFDGIDTWHYKGDLPVGESAVLELKFNTTSSGFKSYTAVAGHNITGDTLNATANVTVNIIKTNLTADAVTTTYNINKDLVITLKGSDGNPLCGVKVSVDLNGAKKYTTDKNGQVKVSTKGLAVKTHTAKITFNGNVKYDKSSMDVKVTVKKATPIMSAKKKTFKAKTKIKKYSITLKDNTGKAIKKAKVTLKVKGKTYKAKTNSKGKATFKIKNLKKKGTYTAVIKYKGDKNYNKITKKVKLAIKAKKSTFKTQSKGSKDKAAVKKIQQALKNNGYYLTYDGHYLKIDGIYHECTERSVKEFQHDKGLKVTGSVDEKTAKKLGIL
jgi:uncharacterized repeat protein (TIGR01451 family)